MDKKQHRKRKNLRKRKKVKRLVIAYLLRAVVILIPVIMIILMVCGCLYIYEKFTKEDEKTDICTDIYTNTYTDTNTGNGTAPITSTTDCVSKFCVIIDAGHGGSDGGTVSGKIIEKDINLSVALKLKTILEDNNIEVILTRNSDEKMSLAQRTSVANDSNADFFISLHCNYYEVVLVYKCGQEKLNNLYYQVKEQRRCSAWRKTKNPTPRNSSSRSWICTMPEELRIHNWNVNMA